MKVTAYVTFAPVNCYEIGVDQDASDFGSHPWTTTSAAAMTTKKNTDTT